MRRLAGCMAAILLCACSGTSTAKRVGTPAGVTSSPGSTAPLNTSTTLGYPVFKVATAKDSVSTIQIFDDPTQAEPSRRLANPDPYYATPRVFLVKEDRGDWLDVMLPMRPNGSTGWIHASDVNVFEHSYHMLIELAAHQITVYDRNDVILQEPVGVGRSATPTTTGLFFTAERIKVLPDQQGAYGPWAYGLSAYSEVLYDFGGGDGQMGIHGTGDPSSVGRDVSNGCIRMHNEAITKLAETLPDAGVPVEIRA